MYGSVSRVLQTRKTIKIAWCFRKFHYNRDSNTNEHLSLSIAWASFGRCSQRRRKNTLTFDSDLARSWALNMFWTQLYPFTPYERSARSGLCARSASLPYRPLYRFCVSMERIFEHASLKLIMCFGACEHQHGTSDQRGADYAELLKTCQSRFSW